MVAMTADCQAEELEEERRAMISAPLPGGNLLVGVLGVSEGLTCTAKRVKADGSAAAVPAALQFSHSWAVAALAAVGVMGAGAALAPGEKRGRAHRSEEMQSRRGEEREYRNGSWIRLWMGSEPAAEESIHAFQSFA